MIKLLFNGFALSLSMLTILPFFKIHDFKKGINGYAVMFYPFVGLLLGYILYGTSCFLESFFTHQHTGMILFFLSVVLSGALHLDGFSDTVDGLFVDRTKALKVMKDPNVGAMGMIFTSSFLILKAYSFAQLGDFYILTTVLMLSRYGAVFCICFFKYINKNGMGYLAKKEFKLWQFFGASIFVFVLCNSFSLFFTTLFFSYLAALFFKRRYGGLSGDMYGFVIESLELLLLSFIIAGVGV